MVAKVRDNSRLLNGAEKTAVIFLCLGEDIAPDIMEEMDEPEIIAISQAMAGLGNISAACVEQVIGEFIEALAQGGNLIGNYETTEKILSRFLDAKRVSEIMSEIRGPVQGRSMWERFSALNENVIANYLKGEYPQTIAAILAKVKPDVAAKVMPLLPEHQLKDVVTRMIQMESVPREVLSEIEDTLQADFLVAASRAQSSDPHERMADIFNRIEHDTLNYLMGELEKDMPDSLTRIKQKMFTFDDLVRLTVNDLSRVIRAAAEAKVLPVALKGAKESVRETFLAALPERSRNILIEEMQIMGPVRSREVQEAQSQVVQIAKQLADEGTIVLPDEEGDDTMIY
jgi:flagellar motor switch protein FliG